MNRFAMTKLRALGCTAVIALIVVASDTGPTETRQDNERGEPHGGRANSCGLLHLGAAHHERRGQGCP